MSPFSMAYAASAIFCSMMDSSICKVDCLKGNCNQNLHLVFIDLIQSTTSITIDTQVLL